MRARSAVPRSQQLILVSIATCGATCQYADDYNWNCTTEKSYPAFVSPDSLSGLALAAWHYMGGNTTQDLSVEPGNSRASMRFSDTQIVNFSPTAISWNFRN
jgi:hypothetical protein